MIDIDFEIQAFAKEAHVMAAYRHPHVLPLHCAFMHQHQMWLIMPYMEVGAGCRLQQHSQHHLKRLLQAAECSVAPQQPEKAPRHMYSCVNCSSRAGDQLALPALHPQPRGTCSSSCRPAAAALAAVLHVMASPGLGPRSRRPSAHQQGVVPARRVAACRTSCAAPAR